MSRRLLIASFTDEHDVVNATNESRERGYKIVDVYTPYAVHGLDKAMGLRPTRLAWLTFFLGLTGAVAKLWYQIWISATSWPVNVGGKPLKSIPAFVPVTFEIMVLFAGVGSVIGFLLYRKLYPGKKPAVLYDGVTDNRFVLVLEESDAAFDAEEVQKMFQNHHAVHAEEQVAQEP
jgi:hypothetical protein